MFAKALYLSVILAFCVLIVDSLLILTGQLRLRHGKLKYFYG